MLSRPGIDTAARRPRSGSSCVYKNSTTTTTTVTIIIIVIYLINSHLRSAGQMTVLSWTTTARQKTALTDRPILNHTQAVSSASRVQCIALLVHAGTDSAEFRNKSLPPSPHTNYKNKKVMKTSSSSSGQLSPSAGRAISTGYCTGEYR